MMIYYYPYRSNNEYVANNIETLTALGNTVRPIKIDSLVKVKLSKQRTIIVLNWVEDRVYGRRFLKSITTFLGLSFLLIYAKLFLAKVVWVRHNFRPHLEKASYRRYRFLCALYSILNISPIGLEAYYSKPSLVHPLYLPDHSIRKMIRNTSAVEPEIRFLIFGSIKPYKGIDKLLATWPENEPLCIRGKCSNKDYENMILNQITKRNLKVDWQNRFISEDELNSTLLKTKNVILPHSDNTMISSGSFYHAISFGCNVIIGESQFGFAKKQQHKFVQVFKVNNFKSSDYDITHVDRKDVLVDALESYGEDKVKAAWLSVIK